MADSGQMAYALNKLSGSTSASRRFSAFTVDVDDDAVDDDASDSDSSESVPNVDQ